MIHTLRLRSLLAAAFALLALATATVGSLAVQHLDTNRARLAVGSEMADLAGQVRNLLDRSMYERWREIQVLASVARTSAPSNDARRSWVEAMRRTFSAYAWIGFADRDGIVRASTGRMLEGASVATRPWFRTGLVKPNANDVHEATLLASKLPPQPSGEPLRFVDIAAPVYDNAGLLEGVIGAHLSWAWAQEMTRSVLDPVVERYADLEALVIAADGTVLLGPKPLLGTKIPAALLMSKTAAEPSPDHGEPSRDTYAVQTWTDDANYLAGVSRT